jgi:dienelactone hydrolase
MVKFPVCQRLITSSYFPSLVFISFFLLFSVGCQKANPMITSTPMNHTVTEGKTATTKEGKQTHIFNPGLFIDEKDIPLDDTDVILDQIEGNYVVHSVTYKGKDGCRVLTYLVTPTGSGPYPALIYLHRDLGHGKSFKSKANRDQFLEEAKLLAQYGVVSLLVESPFLNGCGDVHDQREGYITQVTDIRRGIDLLQQLPLVNPELIGFVGHSYGATWGGVVAGVESRIKAFVLMGGHAFVGKSCCHITNHIPDSHDMEPYVYVGHADNVSFLFMFAEGDQFVESEQAWLYYSSANEPKAIRWYATDHYGLEEVGREDRLTWLGDELGFDYP